MKKKILTGIALLSMALVVALNVNAYDVIQEAGNQQGGGVYVPENCSSSKSCLNNYGTRTTYAGKKHCCAKSGENGKAKL